MNLLAGEGLRNFNGVEVVTQPPLFHLLLAFTMLFGIEPLETGRLVNAAAFGLTILASGLWLRRSLRSRLLALFATLSIMAAHSLNHYAGAFLSEAVFILLTLLALIWLESFLDRKADWSTLLCAALFTALAALSRYTGVVLILTGVMLLLACREMAFSVRLKRAAVFGAVTSIPLAAVMARNWLISGLPTGDRSSATGQSIADSLRQTIDVFNQWSQIWRFPNWDVYLWTAAGLVALAAASAAVLSHRNSTRHPPNEYTSSGLWPALPFGAFALVYMAFIGIAATLTPLASTYSRFMVPAYVPLLLTGALLLDRFLPMGGEGRIDRAKWVLASIILVGVLAHTGISAQRELRLTAHAVERGYSGNAYNPAYWNDSETLKYLRANRLEGRIFSNAPSILWFSDMTAAVGRYAQIPFPVDLDDLARWIKGDSGKPTIVWFYAPNLQYPYRYSHLDIRSLPGVETVAELSDGVVLRVR